MVQCKLYQGRRHSGRKSCSSLWSQLNRSCPNILLKWLHRLVWFPFQHISLILSGSCDCLGSGTRKWISILRMRHSILPNTKMPFWSMCTMNTVPNIDGCWALNPKSSQVAISSPPQCHQDRVNHSLIRMIFPAMMKNTWPLTML